MKLLVNMVRKYKINTTNTMAIISIGRGYSVKDNLLEDYRLKLCAI